MLKLVFRSIFLSFFVSFLFIIFFQKQIFNWFSVITKFALLTLVFTRCHILGTEFLAFDNVFSYYNGAHKGTKKNDQREKHCLLFHSFKCVISEQYNLIEQVVSTVKKPNHSPWQNVEECWSHCRLIYKVSAESSTDFFADILPRQSEKFRNCLGILLPAYFAREFQRLMYIIEQWSVV